MTTPKNQNSQAVPAANTVENITDVDLSTEMEGSFLEYAYSVIYSRALPDARDGLKPVQRRILYQMTEMGLRPDRGHVKSARVVGEVMGKLHPHGDASIYDALVRLAQTFSLRVPLVDGHGNFGSLDDGAGRAALHRGPAGAAAAIAMTDDLDEDVVDFVPNYDNQLTQPEVLPGGVPEPAGQRRERHRRRHGHQHGAAQPRRGRRRRPAPARAPGCHPRRPDDVRARPRPAHRRHDRRARRHPRRLRDRPRQLPHPGHASRVESDHRAASRARRHRAAVHGRPREGHREDQGRRQLQEAQRHLGRHRPHRPQARPAARHRRQDRVQPEAVLEQLYRHTPLEDSFNINNVALVDGQPQTLGPARAAAGLPRPPHLDVVTPPQPATGWPRRQERLHLVEGLLVAILDIDEVIQVIRASDDSDEAPGPG